MFLFFLLAMKLLAQSNILRVTALRSNYVTIVELRNHLSVNLRVLIHKTYVTMAYPGRCFVLQLSGRLLKYGWKYIIKQILFMALCDTQNIGYVGNEY